MPCQLTLLVPGLLQPPQSLQALPSQEQPPFELLNRFFSRAKESLIPVSGFYATLFYLFGITPANQTDYPVAALTRLADTEQSDHQWYLRCDPVCLQADMDRAILVGHDRLGLTEEDAGQLVEILNAHVQKDGWQIEAPTADRWYVKGAKKVRIRTTRPLEVLGKDIKHALPQGPDGRYWCAVMNECQMLLHDLPLNQARQAKGLLPINSLWFWGGGPLPSAVSCQYDAVYSHDPLVAGLALQAGCAYGQIDSLWKAIPRQGDRHLLAVLDDLLLPLAGQDLLSWLDTVKQFERDVLRAVLTMLKDKHLNQVNLLTADGRTFVLTPYLLRRWWKRSSRYRSLLDKAASP